MMWRRHDGFSGRPGWRISSINANAWANEMSAVCELETSEDAFLGGRLQIKQPVRGHRAGIDAVMLAASAPIDMGDGSRFLDAGCGSGVVGLCVASRSTKTGVVGVDIEPRLVALANQNARQNGLAARATFISGDVSAPLADLRDLGLVENSFDHVLANPPFHDARRNRSSPVALRREASSMAPGELERWLRLFAAVTKPSGSVTLVHRADALSALLTVMSGRFGGITIFPLFPRDGAPAKRLLIRGTKGSRAPLVLAHGLVLHDRDGQFTPRAEAILRHGGGLCI